MLKKRLSSIALLAVILIVTPVLVEESVHAESVKQTRIKSISGLKMMKEFGFGYDINNNNRIASFDDSSNTIVYQNSINWFNPGGNIYNENELCAVKQDGKKVKLTSGRVTGSNGFGEIMNYSYKLSAADKTAFVYYEVNVKYRDTIWGQSGSAQALFILN
ncbi:hypothetical protein IHP55_12940 [Enterococcus faecalis]|uniref:hypothetical protein n=1 Tax=Enterococcus faecalis TaxID=1351 RepID=UPI00178091C4|nr:hypothetical protein [Enterococcus faecalis]MBD9891256.1 hypothetical protein [Enterococcus faecalis]MBD9927673.1 hypothetical protein [Enterococcus faecalis]HCQ8731787.1 hypothetical protein [Enterococcus faecalis]